MSRVESPRLYKREDLLVEPDEPALALADDLRLEAAVRSRGASSADLPVLGDQRLRRRAVALVLGAACRLAVRLVADMVGQLDLHRPLHQALGQIAKQPAGPGDLLLRARAGEQLVDHLIADPPIRRHPESLPHPTAATGTIDGLIDQLLAQRGCPPGRAAPRLPSADLRSLPLAAIVAGQPRRDPPPQSLKPRSRLQHAAAALLAGPASSGSRHERLFRSCLRRSSDNPVERRLIPAREVAVVPFIGGMSACGLAGFARS